MDEKTCTKCGETKPLDEFHRLRSSRDGRRPDCKGCNTATRLAYRARNTIADAEYQRQWREANRDKIDASKSRLLEGRPDYYREYRTANPHVGWAASYRKRCRRFDLPPSQVERFTKHDVIERYGDSCFYCEAGAFEEIDHFTPVRDGGSHTLNNIRPSCTSCNRVKHDKPGDEWLAEQAALDDLTEDELEAAIDEEIDRWTQPKESK